MARSPDPGAVAADPVDDAAWADMLAARSLDQPPDWLTPEEHPPDPDDPGTWGEDPAELDELAAQAEADGEDDTIRREALLAAGIGAGWAHYPGAPPVPGLHCGPGGGFGQGQPHDTADPEPGLAALADQAAGEDRGFTGVGDDELMGLIGARNRLTSRQTWELLTALAELIRRRPGPYCKPEGEARMPRVWAEGTSAEVSVQLAITQRAAAGLLALAWDLAVKLPQTSAALRDGTFDQDKAQIVAGWCANLDPDQARAAEDLLFGYPDLAVMTWGMIKDRVARAVMSIDPDAARKRREQGTREARVETRLELSGNMQIAAREIPPASALALDAKLTARARALKKAGIKGNMNRLRMLAYLERWGIVDPFTVPGRDDGLGAGPLPPDEDQASAAQDAQDHDSGPWPEDWPRTDGHDREHRDTDPDDSDPGDSDPDGGNGSDGPADGGNGPGGNGPGGNGPGGCTGGGTGTGEDGMAGWLHLTVPATTLLDHADRAGQLSKLGPVDPGLARNLADRIARNTQSGICITVTGPDGRPVGHACGQPARGDPAARKTSRRKQAPPGTPAPQDQASPALTPLKPGEPGGYGTWRLTYAGRDLDLSFENLDGQCDHRHQAAGHDPGKHLRHLTAVLNQECTFGTCRTPEHRSDYEHAIPWPQGPTCWCNGHPCCRRNHQHKQGDSWHVEGTGQPGHFTWTLPSGRTYLSKPTSYPT